ncbi:flagellar hook-associated protein 2 [Massilia sp. MP_M2]|uniref:flagellar filament capping protein FliD n=1 Tax=Massilia sp. MP_M2 TaxID=3071713 RepID=UPI00319E4934
MASVITAPTYDPITTASALADKYVASRRDMLAAQTKQAAAAERGLSELGATISSFQTSLAALTGTGKTLYAQSVTFSDSAIGSGTASADAPAGTYAFFVKQIATPSQVAFAGLTNDTAATGELSISMGASEAFKVNLAAADSDVDGFVSPRELAAAINAAPMNLGKITASVITTGTTSELVLSSKSTGEDTEISINTAGMDAATSLAKANEPGNVRTLSMAQDAIVHIGAESGTPIKQASNTFQNVDGLTITFNKAQATGTAPVTITAGTNNAATTANVQAFITAYNTLKTGLSKLIYPGNPTSGTAAGAFAADSGVRALHDRLVSLLRPAGGASLASFGIIASKDGTLELRADRLTAQLALTPNGLDKLIGSTSAAGASGIANELNTYLKSWNDVSSGQIGKRKAATEELQSTLGTREALIDKQYDVAYQRYLAQFTQLQSIQSVMNQNVSLFDALFGNDD